MQYDDISQLPPKYQEQVRRKLAAQESKVPKTGQITMTDAERAAVRAAKEREPIVNGASKEEAVRKKYRNQAVTVGNHRFDSKKEARRFITLREMEKCGEIYDLRLQVNFTLIEGFTKPNGERVKPEVYRADFTYYRRDEHGQFTIYIVEDVKTRGTRTEKYLVKKKQMYDIRHIEITEV